MPSSTTKLGINGFGRIGRLVTRAALDNPLVEVVAINDPFLTIEYAAYQLQHDSVHGKLAEEVTHDGTCLIVGKAKIRFFSQRNPAGTLEATVVCPYQSCPLSTDSLFFRHRHSLGFGRSRHGL